MMIRNNSRIGLVLGGLAISGLSVCFTGCPQSGPPTGQTSASESRQLKVSPYRLETSPDGAISLTEASENLGDETKAVTLVGKIDAGEFSAFEPDQATFMLSELPADGHGNDDPDHEDNCPFCKRRAANAPKAIIQIVDADGKIVPTDAQTLLGLQKGDRVIAVGNASYDATVNAITVQCQKIYSGT
ncbi:hypothetical protein [Neorhodopirellula lusitana]|uniref:hypothetical protein n=1 Tax=Neorhodopirellula lusitana TaxID=445327 RepID=UPI00384C95CD